MHNLGDIVLMSTLRSDPRFKYIVHPEGLKEEVGVPCKVIMVPQLRSQADEESDIHIMRVSIVYSASNCVVTIHLRGEITTMTTTTTKKRKEKKENLVLSDWSDRWPWLIESKRSD